MRKEEVEGVEQVDGRVKRHTEISLKRKYRNVLGCLRLGREGR